MGNNNVLRTDYLCMDHFLIAIVNHNPKQSKYIVCYALVVCVLLNNYIQKGQ